MKRKVYKDITVLVILYNTPYQKLINLKQYKNFKLSILEQGSTYNSKKKLQKILNFKFDYYHYKKNLGLSKGINLLIKKTKTKFSLITEPDIFIKENSIINLKKIIKLNKDIFIVGPKYNKKKIKGTYKLTRKIDLSCVLFETKKLKKFKFYDEDFFFFWTDEDLIKRINNSYLKMAIANKSFAKHYMSSSSVKGIYVSFLRDKSYKYGEFVFDYKYKNLRILKVVRQLAQFFVKTIFYVIIFNKKNISKNAGYLAGTLEFILFTLKR